MLATMWRKGNTFGTTDGNANWCNHSGKQYGGSSKKLKIELPYDPAIALLGVYPKDIGVVIQRGTGTPMFIAALSTIANLWKEPKCPSTDEWVKKMWCVYTHTHTHTLEYYSEIKKNEILPFATAWMELECIMLSEISQRKVS